MLRSSFVTVLCASTLLPILANAAPWSVDTAQSKLQFSGAQSGDKFTGGFQSFTPVIEFDLAHPEQGKIDVSIDIASAFIDNDNDKQDSLPKEEWFATKQFPKAAFHSTAIHVTKPNNYLVTGDLTLRGITKPITFPFTLQPSNGAMKATGTFALKRNDFGIGQGKEWSTDQWIAYPVQVSFTIVATPAK